MITYEQNKQELLHLFQSAITFARERNNKDIEQFLTDTMQHVREGKLFIVVCGEFKKGKSSFINALLNEIDLCPVDIDVATSLVSTISYGDPERLTVFFGEPGQEVQQEKHLNGRDEISAYVTEQGNPRNIKRVRLLDLKIPNKLLEAGLIIADTPGIGIFNTEHTDVTSAIVPQADVILYVCDAIEPLSTTELHFMEKYMRKNPHILFIMTKKDKNPQFQVILEDTRQKVAALFERDEKEVVIIPVSNLAKRDYLESQDEEDLKESNFPALETQLWKDLNEGRGRILLAKGGTALGRSLAELRFPIQTELDACRQQDQQQLADMEHEVQAKQQQLKALLENNAQWQQLLSNELNDIQQQVAENFQKGFANIKHFVNTYLDDKHLRDNPEEIATLLQSDMSALLTDIQQGIEKEVTALQGRIEDATRLNLDPYKGFSLAVVEYKPSRSLSERDRPGWWQKSLEVTGGGKTGAGAAMTLLGLMGASVGATLGLLSGGTLVIPLAVTGATIGGAIGQIAGAATGVRRTLKQLKRQERNELMQYLMSFVVEQEAIQAKQLQTTMQNLGRALHDDFITKLMREKKSVEEGLIALHDTRKLTQNQTTARITQLSLLLQRLDQIQQRLEKLLSAALQPAEQTDEMKQKSSLSKANEDWADE